MDAIIQKANREFAKDAGVVEFEIRFGRVPIAMYDAALRAFEALGSGASVENSISVRSQQAGRTIFMRRPYGPGGITIMWKEILDHYEGRDVAQYKISLAREHKINDSAPPSGSDIVRLRSRRSQRVEVGNLWELSLTRVRSMTLSHVKSAEGNAAKVAFFESGAGADSYDVEAELVPPLREALNVIGIKDIIARLYAIAFPAGEVAAESGDARRGLLRAISRVIHRDRGEISLKRMLNSARSMTRALYLDEVYPLAGYKVTHKADGVRGLAIVTRQGEKKHCAVISDAKMWGTAPGNFWAIYDGEIIEQEGGSVSFYAFDCLMTDGRQILNLVFEERLSAIEDAEFEGIKVRRKVFADINPSNIQEVVERAYAESRAMKEFRCDGLIFVQQGQPYFETKNYKWKPAEANTIDFLCLRCPERMYGVGAYKVPREPMSAVGGRREFHIYLLYCAVSESQMRNFCLTRLPMHDMITGSFKDEVIHFACSFEPHAYILIVRGDDLAPFGGDIHGRVLEMRWRQNEDRRSEEHDPWRKWDLLRVREERRLGNNIGIANEVFANYVDPFPLEALWNPVAGYFEDDGGRGDFYLASNKLRRFLLTTILCDTLKSGNARILEFGGGRAGDFVRYRLVGASLVVNLDNDPSAIAAGVMRAENSVRTPISETNVFRWMQHVRDFVVPAGATGCAAPQYIARVLDLAHVSEDGFSAAIRAIGEQMETFTAVIATFSFHYFCASREMVARLLRCAKASLTRGGVVIITTMIGERVFERLRDNGGVWIARDDDERKYEIRAAYDGTALLDFGQMIRVSVPFSTELREEPLCNFEAVSAVARECGFDTCERIEFSGSARIDAFARADPHLAGKLTQADREYNALFGTLILRQSTPTIPVIAKSRVRKPARK